MNGWIGRLAAATTLLGCAGLASGMDTVRFAAIDIDGLLAEDAAQRAAAPAPDRFAVPRAAELTPGNSGTLEPIGDGRMAWRLRIETENAKSVNLGMLWNVPASAEVWLLDARGEAPFRALTAADNKAHGELWTPPVRGGVVEVYAEFDADEVDAFLQGVQIFSVNLGYEHFVADWDRDADAGSRNTATCHIDVACEDSGIYADPIDAVGRQIVSGQFLCSGSLVNNTAEDGRPLWFTAEHCGLTAGNDQTLVVVFNYQNSFCRTVGSPQNGNTGNGSEANFISGSQWLMSWEPADTTLAELSQTPPASWNVYYAGWDRTSSTNSSSFGIHHPAGQEKRISFDNGFSTFVDGGNLHQVVFDEGGVEGGSSGSPLFNEDARVRGPACCVADGNQFCSPSKVTFYGSMHRAWTGGGTASSRLSDHLDPLGLDLPFFNGLGDGAPQAFGLVSPANGSQDVVLPITLDWEDAPLAYGYDVEVVEVGVGTFFSATVTDSQVQLTGSLQGGSVYEWTVTATNLSGQVVASNGPFTFEPLDLRPPASFELLSPVDGATNVSLTPVLDWAESDRANEYRVVMTDLSAGQTVLDETIPATSSEYAIAQSPLAALDAGVEYRWAVLARNSNGSTQPLGGFWRFTTEGGGVACPGDLTGDNAVDGADLLEVINNFGSDGSNGGDGTGDGAVDGADLLAVINNFGATCP